MTDLTLGDYTLDNGLAGLKTACNEIWVCSATPSDYASAVTNQLGTKSFGAGSAFDTVGAGSPAGRAVSSIAVTDGTITTNGTVACWAAVDSSGSALLAQGTLSGGGSVTATQTWTLDAFSIHLNGTSAAADSTSATNFDARAVAAYPTLDTAHRNAYKALLNGLTTDGLIASDGSSTFFDALYVFATTDASIAVLNLIANANNLTSHGGMTFAADVGYHAVSANTDYLDTGLAENANGNFKQNAAHLSAWVSTFGTTGNSAIGCASGNNNILINFGGLDFYARINNSSAGGVSNGGVAGHFMGNRDSASNWNSYHNGIDVTPATHNEASVSLGTNMFHIPDEFQFTDANIMAASIGGSMNATQVGYLYTRLHTYLQTIAGVA